MSFFTSLVIIKAFSFVWLLSLKPAQEPDPNFSTYSTDREVKEPIEAEIDLLLEQIEKPRLAELFLLTDWKFSVGDERETFIMNYCLKPQNAVSVDLPHQFAKPNSILWYSKTISLAEPSVIRISADDGAQLFVNGVQQKRIAGEAFQLPGKDEIRLSIRVINNAMSGGLKKVSLVMDETYDDFRSETERFERYQLLAQKLKHFHDADKERIKIVKQALETQDDHLLLQAEDHFKDYPYIIAGPYLQKPAKDSLHILMETDGNCDCKLLTGKTETDLERTLEDADTALHDFRLALKSTDSLLYYRLQCVKTFSRVYKVHLTEKKDFSFNVWADSQGGWKTFSDFIRNVHEGEDAFGIGVGDLVNNGADPHAWQSFLAALCRAGGEIPFYLLPGNHDYDGAYDDLNPNLFHRYIRNGRNNNYFSWSYANCAFIALDPNENFPVGIPKNSHQYDWFLEQLKTHEWLSADWRFVLVHQPPFSQGWPGYHGEESIKKLIFRTAEGGKIDFVISGHTHDYEKLSKNIGSQNVNFLIVGGAGGSLEPSISSEFPKMDTLIKSHHIGRFNISGKQLKFSVIGHRDEVLDAFELSK